MSEWMDPREAELLSDRLGQAVELAEQHGETKCRVEVSRTEVNLRVEFWEDGDDR